MRATRVTSWWTGDGRPTADRGGQRRRGLQRDRERHHGRHRIRCTDRSGSGWERQRPSPQYPPDAAGRCHRRCPRRRPVTPSGPAPVHRRFRWDRMEPVRAFLRRVRVDAVDGRRHETGSERNDRRTGLGAADVHRARTGRDRAGGRPTRAVRQSDLRHVARMAKYGRISNSGGPDDGLFEVVSCRHGHRWRIAAMALRATTVGLGPQPRVDRVEFATVDAVPVQIDGEIFHLEPASEIVIDSVPQALATVG